MFSALNDTLASVKDKTYGTKIIARPLKQVIWYWLKYVIFFFIVPTLVLIGLITYFIPQLPRLVSDNIPSGKISLQSGKFSTSYSQPLSLGSPDFAIIINTHGSPADVDRYPSGLLLLSDKIIVKTPDNQVLQQSLTDLGDFSLTQSQLLDWLTHHQLLLLSVSFLMVILLTLISLLFYVGYKLLNFLVWSAVLLLIGKIFKHKFNYLDNYKIIIYAAVPSLIISALLFAFPSPLVSLLNLGLFVYLIYFWLTNLPVRK